MTDEPNSNGKQEKADPDTGKSMPVSTSGSAGLEPDKEAKACPKQTDHSANKHDPSVGWFRRKLDEANLADWAIAFFTLIIAATTIAYTVYAGRQWNAMQESNRINRATLVATQRAWIQVTEKHFTWEVGAPIVWAVDIVNIGKTMAFRTTGCIAIQYVQTGQEPVYDYTRGRGHPCMDFQSGITYPNIPVDAPVPLFVSVRPGVKPTQPMVVTPDRYREISEGKAYLAIHGRIDYEDIFGGKHWIRFCDFTRPMTIQYEFLSKTCAAYNGVDAEQ